MRNNRRAALWRQLLIVGSQYPKTLGYHIRPLGWSFPVLTNFVTIPIVGDFLRAIYPYLTVTERERMELAILAIPDSVSADQRSAGERVRNRLLLHLPIDLATESAQALHSALKQHTPDVANATVNQGIETELVPSGEVEYFTSESVQMPPDTNQRIRELEASVQKFAEAYSNAAPSDDAVISIFPVLRSFYQILSELDDIQPEQPNNGWTTLAAACREAAATLDLNCTTETGELIRHILLQASQHPDPGYHPMDDARLEVGLVRSPAIRIEAAGGVMILAQHQYCIDETIVAAIRRLSTDPVAAVRLQIAGRLTVLEGTNPELMWQIAEDIAHQETNRGVIQGLVGYALPHLAHLQPDRVATLMSILLERITGGPGAEQVREMCIKLCTNVYIWNNHARCREMLEHLFSKATSYAGELQYILMRLRKLLNYGPVGSSEPIQDEVRQRALGLLHRLLEVAQDGLQKLETDHQGTEVWSETSQEQAKSLLKVVESIAREIYFVSGAYDRSQTPAESDDYAQKESIDRCFYQEVAPIFDMITNVGYPTISHHLVETLEYWVPFDPRGVFLRLGRVVRAGQQGGYQYESIAADEIVKLIERYLAEHRSLFRKDEACRQTLLEILDIFVQVGWPDAQRLTYRLEDIFR